MNILHRKIKEEIQMRDWLNERRGLFINLEVLLAVRGQKTPLETV